MNSREWDGHLACSGLTGWKLVPLCRPGFMAPIHVPQWGRRCPACPTGALAKAEGRLRGTPDAVHGLNARVKRKGASHAPDFGRDIALRCPRPRSSGAASLRR